MVWRNPYRPVETVDDLPAFCGACGRPMKRRIVVRGFSTVDGGPLLDDVAWCSRWWFGTRGDFTNGHEAYIVSPFPELEADKPSGQSHPKVRRNG